MAKTFKLILICACIGIVLNLTSCGSSRSTVVSGADARIRVDKQGTKNTAARTNKGKAGKHGKKAGDGVASALVAEARTWLGTPYSYGGKTRQQGTDCSGFVMEVYRVATGIDIPRSSNGQKEYCENLDRDELEVGDLVFFSSKRSGDKIAHVGLYIGNGTMIHASSSKGVIESSLDQNYYVQHYIGAGRIPQIASVRPPRKQKTEPVTPPVESQPEKLLAQVEHPVPTVKEEPKKEVRVVIVDEPQPTPAAVVRNAFTAMKQSARTQGSNITP